MPTNLPPEYYEAEERYKTAQTTDEKVAALEELLSTIPKHKGTDKLRADFRKRLSKLKAAAQSHKGVAKQTSVFHIDREGAGQVAVVGCANVGKSALIATLTNATPEVAEYPFTTWVPTPGMMPVENIQIQLIDTPPLNPDYVEGELLNLIRRADLILLLVDLQSYPLQQLEDATTILEEHRVLPDQWRSRYADPRRLIFKPVLVVANKCDDESLDEDFEVLCELVGDDWSLVRTSITTGRGLEELKEIVFQRLEIMRIYAKPPGAQPDFSAPFILRRDGTVGEFAAKVHRDFLENLKSARVWGEGVFDGQMVGREHILHDGDVVELRM